MHAMIVLYFKFTNFNENPDANAVCKLFMNFGSHVAKNTIRCVKRVRQVTKYTF